MPMPIAHSAAGFAGYLALHDKKSAAPIKQELFLLGLCLFLANLPDLDFIPGFIYGEPGKFHHGPSHSIFISLLITLICYRLLKNRLKSIAKKRFFVCFLLALFSHPLLDFLSEDTSIPFGVPLFWPLDCNYYISSLPFFQDVQRIDYSVASFFPSLLNANNGLGVIVESLFAGLILFALFGFKNYSKPLRSLSCFLISLICGFLYYLLQIRPNLI